MTKRSGRPDGGGRSIRLNARRCAEIRRAQGLSQEALAARTRGPRKLSVQTVKRAERGEPIYLDSAMILAHELGAPIASLCHRAPPVIVVREFVVDSAPNERLNGFARALADGVQGRLARWHLQVLAEHGKSHSINDSSAGYDVRGTVRVIAEEMRVSVDLIDIASGIQFGGGDFDMKLPESFSAQDALATRIVSHIAAALVDYEIDRSLRLADVELDAWQLALRGVSLFHQCTAPDNLRARHYFERALESDPTLPLPRYMLVLSHEHDLLNQWSMDVKGTMAAMCQQALELERHSRSTPLTQVSSAYVSLASSDPHGALDRLSQLSADLQLKGDPHLQTVQSLLGQTLAMSGKAEDGLCELERGPQLGAFDRGRWVVFLTKSLIHFARGSYADAMKWAHQAVHEKPRSPICRVALVAAESEYKPDKFASMARKPEPCEHMVLDGFDSIMSSTNTEISARFRNALRRAGF